MYTQIFLVTSVRGMVLPPQIFANASLSFFGAKMPFPDFFWANACFLPFAFFAVIPTRRFSAVIFLSVAFVIVVFFVVVVVTTVFVVALEVALEAVFATVFVVVIAIEGLECTHALSL